MDKSPIVTLNGLNTVYTDLLNRIEALGNIYHIRGSFDTLEELIEGVAALEDGVKEGDAYNVVHDRFFKIPTKDSVEENSEAGDASNVVNDSSSEKDPTKDGFEENANYVCIKKYKGNVCTINNWTKYWFRINSAFEVANKDSLGLIKLYGDNEGNTLPTNDLGVTLEAPSDKPNQFVNRKLLLRYNEENKTDNNNYKAYINIPVASPYTYGVVDTKAQTFVGNKTFEGEGHFNSGVHITGKLKTASASGSLCSLIIAESDADTKVGDVYVGGTLTVVNDAVFNDVKGINHSLLLTEANDALDYDKKPVNSENSLSTSTIGNMNVKGTLTVNNLATVDTVNAGNATFKITGTADINKLDATINLGEDTANLTVTNTATIGRVNAEDATFNINKKATIANLSATNLNVNNQDSTFDNKATKWNQVDVLKVTNDSTHKAELNVSTRADISNVSATNLNATALTADTIDIGELSGSGNTLTFTDSAEVTNIKGTTTLNATILDVNKLSSNSGTLNVGAGGEVSNPKVTIQGSDGSVKAESFTIKVEDGEVGTFSKKDTPTNTVNLNAALYIESTNAQDSVPSKDSYALGVNGGIYAPRIKGEKVYGAVWNDLVDCIEVDDECELEYGRCYAYNKGKFTKTSKYADKSYIGIHSDTSGFEMGDKGDVKQLKSSVAGYVLAYVDEEYPSGTPLTCSKHGVLTKAHFLTRILHPEMVIATYWKNEPKFVWGAEGNEIEVKGRHWVRIK